MDFRAKIVNMRDRNDFPMQFQIGVNGLEQANIDPREIRKDPRGITYMWEPPLPNARYIVSCDPTFGIPGWSRYSRQPGDRKTDNCAIEVIRLNAIQQPVYDARTDKLKLDKENRIVTVPCDLQVCEYLGPIDPVEASKLVRMLARIYRGREDEYAETIFEAWPGPGVLMLQELLRLRHTNLWMWEYIADNIAEVSSRVGWRSTPQSQVVLWNRARKHIMSRQLKVMSPRLTSEYANAVVDTNRMRAQASYGFHDDLLQAVSMALWAGNRWTYGDEPPAPVIEQSSFDMQKYAPTMDDDVGTARELWSDLVESWED